MHDIYICKCCAEICHKGHEVVDCGIQKSYCSCGMKKLPQNFKCSLLEFNSNFDGCSCTKQKQRIFQCTSCGLYGSDDLGICYNCSRKCHSYDYNHNVIDCGVKDMKCTCNYSNCFLCDDQE